MYKIHINVINQETGEVIFDAVQANSSNLDESFKAAGALWSLIRDHAFDSMSLAERAAVPFAGA